MSPSQPHQISLAELLALNGPAAALDLSSRKRVLTDMGGTHLSGFRGRGMEFEEHRAYQAGDDVRSIDWRVTARTGQTHIKLFREERERPVYLVVDGSPSMQFATRGVFKSVLAAQAAALLGWAAVANRDRVGGVLANPNGLLEVRPGSGRRGLLRYLNHLVATQSEPERQLESAPLKKALQHLDRLARSGSVVILLTDFQSLAIDAKPLLQKLAGRCELIVGMISDPFERELPQLAGMPVTTATESDRRWFIKAPTTKADAADMSPEQAASYPQRQQYWAKAVQSAGAHWLDLDTAQPVLEQLTRGLGRHHRAQVG